MIDVTVPDVDFSASERHPGPTRRQTREDLREDPLIDRKLLILAAASFEDLAELEAAGSEPPVCDGQVESR